ncbi:MAG TPA: HK97 gp10 family phage protein [Sphingomonas sp.]|uniref:HK97 gp10 family phage protein n=1 Tax=Sphingomonas sp. TaxID=28214 RepID=UPI002ED98F48
MARGGLKRLAAGLGREVAPYVLRAAEVVEDEAKGSIMAGSASGSRHVASRPGEAPNNDVGDLIRGIESTQPEPLRAVVTSHAAHGALLEYGSSRMAERPYMRPAANAKRKEVAAIIAKATTRAIRKLGAA